MTASTFDVDGVFVIGTRHHTHDTMGSPGDDPDLGQGRCCRCGSGGHCCCACLEPEPETILTHRADE